MSIDYTSYSDDPIQDDIVDVVEIVDTDEVVDENPTMMGTICNASKVYMRKAPDKDSKHVDILEKGEEVMIDGTEDDVFGNGWYHLITASGNEGYTMSEFVKIVE